MRDGYTLIELLVVMSILTLMAAMVLPRLNHREQDTGAFATALSTYLNGASAYADGHETRVCVTQSGNLVTASPWTQTLTVPNGINVAFSGYCYDQKGEVDSTQTLTVSAESTSHQVKVPAGCGTASVH